jgi:hypothetical protein
MDNVLLRVSERILAMMKIRSLAIHYADCMFIF